MALAKAGVGAVFLFVGERLRGVDGIFRKLMHHLYFYFRRTVLILLIEVVRVLLNTLKFLSDRQRAHF